MCAGVACAVPRLDAHHGQCHLQLLLVRRHQDLQGYRGGPGPLRPLLLLWRRVHLWPGLHLHLPAGDAGQVL